MARASTFAMALGAALALGACADGAGDLTTAPNSPAFQTSGHGGIVLACSPSDLQKYARNLFPSNSFAVAQAKLITSKNANQPATLEPGYNVMAEVAKLRSLAAGAWTPAQQSNAADLTIQLIGCMDVTLSDITLTGPNAPALLRLALLDALDPDGSGAYAVPGALALVTSQDKLASLETEGPGTFETWLPGGKSLVLGREINSFATEKSGGIAYDWSTVRPYTATTYAGNAIVGLCANSLDQAGAMRIEHAHGSNTIRPYALAAFLDCPETIGLGFPAARTFAGRLVQQLFALVQPQPAFASAAVATGGPGGLIKSLSPFEVVDPDTVKVAFANDTVADVAVNQEITDNHGQIMRVTVTGNNGVPWEAVDVTIVGIANNGATLDPTCNEQATDQNGVATFKGLAINKPGGMRLVASVAPPGDNDGTLYVGSDETLRFGVAPGSGPAPSCQ